MKTLIIGEGEIGKSLFKILFEEYCCCSYDVKYNDLEYYKYIQTLPYTFEIMHICFPYSKTFINDVKEYQKTFNPKYTVIHSTVPVGTSRKLNAVHSPCIGIHPHLATSMKTFTKYLSGKYAGAVADYFRRAGMKVAITDKQETTELAKILCTTYYGMCIEYTKDVKRLCDKYNVPFEFWTIWTDNYNQGYQKLGYSEYTRPNLVPNMKKIGGHCVVNNTELLETTFTKFIKELNKEK